MLGGTSEFLGAVFSNVPIQPGDTISRPSAGGGGFGDPLERPPEAVLEDVIDGYVTPVGARKDYGVVLVEVDQELDRWEIDQEGTQSERARIRASRIVWLSENAEGIAARYRAGELDVLDLVRRYGVIVDWQTGELLPTTTAQFRAMLWRRAGRFWGLAS